MTGQKKYSTYTFEDFLQDDFFIESIKRPTEERIAFWQNFLKEHPEQSKTYHAARKFLADVTRPQVVAEMWDNIQMKIKHARRLGKIRRIAYTSMAVAASIALLFVARIFFIGQTGNDIMDFVANNMGTISADGEIQLIVSEQKTVYLREKEAVITYDSTTINTGAEKLSKNEMSAFNQLIVPYGKSSVVILHDGTKIWVNAGTRLVYPVAFETNKREIYVNGEVFLDVAPDEQRPFIVRTDNMRIQVVGTKFNVQAYATDEQSRIALAEGAVKIISSADDILLNPNQLYEQDKSGNSSVKDADIENYTSWIYSVYLYESERLDVILKRLERYYGKEIVVEPSISEISCSGKLNLKENVEDVLLVICAAASVEYVKDGEKYIISHQSENNMFIVQ